MLNRIHMQPAAQQTGNYVIRGGRPGRERLRILHEAIAPGSRAFFEHTGIAAGQKGLDLGCGGGAVTLDLAHLVGRTGTVTGIDKDAENISFARKEAEALGLSQVSYQLADLEEWEGKSGYYDFAYSRFLLTHLAKPIDLVRKVRRSLKAGGRILLEDIDFAGHFCFPDCAAFDNYVTLYTAAVQRMGANPNIGPSLPLLVRQAGFQSVQLRVVQPVFQKGDGKRMASLTLQNIADTLIREQLATRETIASCLAELAEFEQDETTIMSLPRIFQVWAVK